jgi:hypothetical protein
MQPDGEPAQSGGTVARVFAWLVIACSACLGGVALRDLLSPPYTDGQIRASFVDTWGTHAIVASVSLFLLTVLGLACIAMLAGVPSRARRTVAAALASCIIAWGLVLAAHAAMTQRVTALTGQYFGGFWGLL